MKNTNENAQQAALVRTKIRVLTQQVEMETQRFLDTESHYRAEDLLDFASVAAGKASELEPSTEVFKSLGRHYSKMINDELKCCRIAIANTALVMCGYKSRSAARKRWIAFAADCRTAGDQELAKQAHEVLWVLTAGWTLGGSEEEIALWESLEWLF